VWSTIFGCSIQSNLDGRFWDAPDFPPSQAFRLRRDESAGIQRMARELVREHAFDVIDP
jgi:hypothetical protein